MVAADVAQAYTEGRVPTNISYITPEYLSESRDGPAKAGIITVFVIVTILICCRFFSRVFIVKSFGPDDWLAVLSYIGYIAFLALSIILISEGSGRHIEYIQYVLPINEVNKTESLDYAAHLVYTATLWCCRLSGLAFFHRLCEKHQTFRIAIWASTIFLTSCFLVQFFLILLHCSPTTGLWPYAWQAESANYTCLNWGVVYVTNSGLSLACDFLIFSIPTAMIVVLQLPASKKAVLSVVLLPGTLVIGYVMHRSRVPPRGVEDGLDTPEDGTRDREAGRRALMRSCQRDPLDVALYGRISCARLWLCVVGQWNTDGSWFYDPQLAIEVAEIGGTLIAISVPSLKPMLSRWYSSMRSTIDRSRGHSSQYARASSVQKPSAAGTWGAPSQSFQPRTLVSGSPARHSRESDSVESLLHPDTGGIHVTRDVDLKSIPLAHLGKGSS